MSDSNAYKIGAEELSELGKLLEEAAERGAAKALKELGLTDPGERDNLKEVIGLAKTWREAKSTVAKTTLQILTAAVLGALALGMAMGLIKQVP